MDTRELSETRSQRASLLHSEIEAEVRVAGQITFARFMELALYSENGYYSARESATSDYSTSPQVHPAFGSLIAKNLIYMWEKLGSPDQFSVVEIGAGDGTLMLDICEAIDAIPEPSESLVRFQHALTYEAYDLISSSSSTASSQTITPTVKHIDLIHTAEPISAGCVLSNELIDAFPVNIFVIRNGYVLELYVTLDDLGNFIFTEDTPSSYQIIDRVGDIAHNLSDDYRGEVNLGIVRWADTVARLLKSGYVMTIDYGYPRDLLYHPERFEGSLRCYRNHVLRQNPLSHIGCQDITAHVDFTEVDVELSSRGFENAAPPQYQRHFLYHQGIGDYLVETRKRLRDARTDADIRRHESNFRALNALIDPRALGSFYVAQHRINAPRLDEDTLQTTSHSIPMSEPKLRHLRYA